jgi:hypothetical protein
MTGRDHHLDGNGCDGDSTGGSAETDGWIGWMDGGAPIDATRHMDMGIDETVHRPTTQHDGLRRGRLRLRAHLCTLVT